MLQLYLSNGIDVHVYLVCVRVCVCAGLRQAMRQVSELESLANSLSESVKEKSIALSHQKKANKSVKFSPLSSVCLHLCVRRVCFQKPPSDPRHTHTHYLCVLSLLL